MSHISTVKVIINNIDALRSACQKMGFELLTNASPRAYFQQPKTDYVVKLPGRYDVGVTRQKDGTFLLSTDFYQGDVTQHVGQNCGLLTQRYVGEVCRRQSAMKGTRFTEKTLENGTVEYEMISSS